MSHGFISLVRTVRYGVGTEVPGRFLGSLGQSILLLSLGRSKRICCHNSFISLAENDNCSIPLGLMAYLVWNISHLLLVLLLSQLKVLAMSQSEKERAGNCIMR